MSKQGGLDLLQHPVSKELMQPKIPASWPMLGPRGVTETTASGGRIFKLA